MVALAAHRVDEIIPKVRIRQWVITFPFDVRLLLAWNNKFRSNIISAVMRGLQRHYVKQALEQGGKNPKFGGDFGASAHGSAMQTFCALAYLMRGRNPHSRSDV